MINVVLLGTGNVATHLFRAFSASKTIQVKQVYNHTQPGLSYFKSYTETTTSLEELIEADIYLLALKDDIIPDIASQLRHKKGLVVHTSGGASIDVLKDCPRSGVFYPLQTFSKTQPVNYCEIPFCLETNTTEDLELLKRMAGEISGKIYEVSSPQRKKLHLAAVFVCNFVNYLYTIGENICLDNNLPFEILQPLIAETANRVKNNSPQELQTGPAKRGDQSTINSHLELISSSENKEIYQLLTNAIQNLHGKKL